MTFETTIHDLFQNLPIALVIKSIYNPALSITFGLSLFITIIFGLFLTLINKLI